MSGRVRQRRLRERRSRGVRVIAVELSDEALKEAERQGRIYEHEMKDPEALSKALGFMIEDALGL